MTTIVAIFGALLAINYLFLGVTISVIEGLKKRVEKLEKEKTNAEGN